MEDVDRDSWQKAMESEIESMYTNQVWNHVDPSEGINQYVVNRSIRGKNELTGKWRLSKLD